MYSKLTINKIAFLLLLFLIIILFSQTASAQDDSTEKSLNEVDEDEIIFEEAYTFPVIRPEITFLSGYRFIDTEDSEKSEEYEYLHNSIVFSGEARIFSFPHRFHLDMDVKNKMDYFGDVSYAYRDLILFRGINRTLYHNLDNIRLLSGSETQSPAPFAPAYFHVDDKDEKYGIKSRLSNFFLRFKMPDFPFHVYLDATIHEKSGSKQMINLLGSGWYNSVVRTAQSRDIDWNTRTITFGTNSHLGPVEIDISHSEKTFDSGRDSVLYNTYSAAGAVRNSGTYPFAFYPDLKSFTDTLKLHTSYTGRIVASATLSRTEKENKSSHTKVKYFIGAGDLTWMPLVELTFFLKYRHKEIDIRTPDNVPFPESCSSSNNSAGNYTCFIRPLISSINDTLTATMRYRPLKCLTLKAEVSYDDKGRKDSDEWNIPSSSQKTTITLSADAGITRGLNIKTRYIHKKINNPTFNTDPDRSDEGMVSVSWRPFPQVNAIASYVLRNEARDDLVFVDASGNIIKGDNRRNKNEKLFGSIILNLVKDLSITAGYSNTNNTTEQDLAFAGPIPATIDNAVPYTYRAQSFLFGIDYIPIKKLSLHVDVNHTKASGIFRPSDREIASFSELKTRETVWSASGEYRFKNGLSTGIHYKYSRFNDVKDNIYDDLSSGRAQVLLFTLSMRF